MTQVRLGVALMLLCAALGRSMGQGMGSLFPYMKTRTADGKWITLPGAAEGKYTILVVACSPKAEKDLRSWFTPLLEKFVMKPEGLLAQFAYDVNLYFVPIFAGAHTLAAPEAKKKTLDQVDPLLIPRILFYQGESASYEQALGLNPKTILYLFALNPEGKIVEKVSGGYEPVKMSLIESAVNPD